MNIAEQLTQVYNNVDNVFEAGFVEGKTDANNYFWDRYQHYGSRNSYSYAFFGNGWSDYTYNPQYKIYTEPKTDRARYMFAWSGIVDTKVPIEINGGGTTAEPSLFHGCKRLKTIREIYINNYNGAYTDWFKDCTSLENITIKGQIKNNGFDIHYSTRLTAESIYNIVSALSSTTSGYSVILPSTAEATYNKKPPANAPKTFKELKETKMNWVIDLYKG